MERQPNNEELLRYYNERRRVILEALATIDHKIFLLGYVTTQEPLFDEEDWIVRGDE